MNYLFTYGPVPADEAEKVPLKDTEIGLMPEDWEIVRISDVAQTKSGGTPNRSKSDYYGGQIRWVKSGELNDDLIRFTEENITELGLNESSAKIFASGTLLMAMYGATAGKVGILDFDAATNQAVCGIFPSERLNKNYLFYALISRRNELLNERYGGAQPNISQTVIKSFKVPLPNSNVQKNVFKILSSSDFKLKSEENKKKAVQELFKSLLNDLMTAKVRVNELELIKILSNLYESKPGSGKLIHNE